MTVLVSVVIPTLRRPGLVIRALGSVLAQTWPNLEVIVVVDGPDPDTLAVLGRVTDKRVQVIANPASLGPGTARNLAAERARGDWIAFLDDDDEWLPDKLARQLGGRSSADKVIVSCLSEVRTPGGTYVWPRTPYDGSVPVDEYLFDRRSAFRGDAYVGTSSYVMPTSLFRASRFGDTRNNEDTTLLLRATKEAGGRLEMVPAVLVRLFREEARPSLGASFDWRDMFAWVNGMRPLFTPRAYSGFCLVYLASAAARQRDYGGWLRLVAASFAHGRPTAMQLGTSAALVLLPPRLRRALRGAAHSVRR